mmetsp:Transcript_44955/g.103979  ORF Transcript_44955/g.103979 Transcript_44955/m.103979 type:complete len:258 (-) Transcript_44955:32-805(-)
MRNGRIGIFILICANPIWCHAQGGTRAGAHTGEGRKGQSVTVSHQGELAVDVKPVHEKLAPEAALLRRQVESPSTSAEKSGAKQVSFALAELAAALANNVASAQGDSMTQSAMQQLSGSKKAEQAPAPAAAAAAAPAPAAAAAGTDSSGTFMKLLSGLIVAGCACGCCGALAAFGVWYNCRPPEQQQRFFQTYREKRQEKQRQNNSADVSAPEDSRSAGEGPSSQGRGSSSAGNRPSSRRSPRTSAVPDGSEVERSF